MNSPLAPIQPCISHTQLKAMVTDTDWDVWPVTIPNAHICATRAATQYHGRERTHFSQMDCSSHACSHREHNYHGFVMKAFPASVISGFVERVHVEQIFSAHGLRTKHNCGHSSEGQDQSVPCRVPASVAFEHEHEKCNVIKRWGCCKGRLCWICSHEDCEQIHTPCNRRGHVGLAHGVDHNLSSCELCSTSLVVRPSEDTLNSGIDSHLQQEWKSSIQGLDQNRASLHCLPSMWTWNSLRQHYVSSGGNNRDSDCSPIFDHSSTEDCIPLECGGGRCDVVRVSHPNVKCSAVPRPCNPAISPCQLHTPHAFVPIYTSSASNEVQQADEVPISYAGCAVGFGNSTGSFPGLYAPRHQKSFHCDARRASLVTCKDRATATHSHYDICQQLSLFPRTRLHRREYGGCVPADGKDTKQCTPGTWTTDAGFKIHQQGYATARADVASPSDLIDLRSIVQRPRLSIEPELSIEKVFQLFNGMAARYLPVVDSSGWLLGIVTRRQMVLCQWNLESSGKVPAGRSVPRV